MPLTDEEKAYIEKIVRESLNVLPCVANSERVAMLERKVYNGFGLSIQWLKWIVGVMFTGMIGMAFWKIRG